MAEQRIHTEIASMSAETLVALRESIKKWEAKASGANVSSARPEWCPLCVLFNNENTPPKDICVGCPVSAAGHHLCEDTPYEDYQIARARGRVEARLSAAQAEVDFLKSLLPPVTDDEVTK